MKTSNLWRADMTGQWGISRLNWRKNKNLGGQGAGGPHLPHCTASGHSSRAALSAVVALRGRYWQTPVMFPGAVKHGSTGPGHIFQVRNSELLILEASNDEGDRNQSLQCKDKNLIGYLPSHILCHKHRKLGTPKATPLGTKPALGQNHQDSNCLGVRWATSFEHGPRQPSTC